MSVQIDDATIDEIVAIKQLKVDLKDDWFQDPIGYDDYLNSDLLAERLRANSTKAGAYTPSERQLINIPKANYTLRYALETSLVDRLVYHGLVAPLLTAIDPLLHWRVFSHRADPDKRRVRYTFRNGVDAWRDFLGAVTSALPAHGVLLSTDLANYFENIDLVILADRMRGLVGVSGVAEDEKASLLRRIDVLIRCLSKWAFSEKRGLPQNRDASSFLANVYMQIIDERMIGAGFNYFRYMDDIKIACDSMPQARLALKTLILGLREIGLAVNSGKTKFISTADQDAVSSELGLGSVELRRLDSAWRTKSLRPIERSFIPLKNFAMRIMREAKFDSREFRFCISRLETLARCEEFSVPPQYFRELTTHVLAGLDEAPAATDYLCKYLRAVDLDADQMMAIEQHVIDEERMIYNWKNYRIWLLLAQKSQRSDRLTEAARRQLLERGDDATRAGATLYLGAIGEANERNLIAERFGDLKSFLGQRCALIAVQDVHYKPRRAGGVSISTHVQEHLRPDLIGVYKAIRGTSVYVTAPETVSITRFVDTERDYE